MKLKKVFILTSVIFIFAVTIFSQTKEITYTEFLEQIGSGFVKELKQPIRKIRTIEDISNGELTSQITILEENIEFDKFRELRTTISDGEKDVVETIKIGDVFYCRNNDKPWRKLTYNCHSFFDRDETYEENGSKYTVENVKLNGREVKLYKGYISSENFYSDSKIWITNEGFVLKKIIQIGDKNKTEKDFTRTTETIEYNPVGLKVEAPEIKNNEVGEKEFQEIFNKAETLKEGKSYRRERYNMVLEEDGLKLLREYTMIDEVLPPDRRYHYYRDEEADLITTSEEITVGDKYFERKDGGKWKTTVTVKFGSPGGEKIEVNTKTIRFLGTEKYKDKTFKVYEMFEKFSSNVEGDIERTIRYRFDQKGLLWSKTKSERNLRDSVIVIVTDNYDFEANINIKAPIMKENKPTKNK